MFINRKLYVEIQMKSAVWKASGKRKDRKTQIESIGEVKGKHKQNVEPIDGVEPLKKEEKNKPKITE